MIKFKRFRSVTVSAIALSLAVLAGCGGGGDTPATKSAQPLPPAVTAALRGATPVPTTIVAANNNFGFQLLAQMRTTDTGKNIFISPTSVSLAFDILYNGAAGSTQTAMAQTLGIGGLSTALLNTDNADLQASLVSSDPAVQLTVANSFWYHKATGQILQSFVNTNTQYYGTYLGDLAGAPANINNWVSEQTNGKITQVVGNEVSQYVAMLVNAVYFKGAWTTSFDPNLTTPGTFTLADGVTTVNCNLMRSQATYPYYVGDHFQAVQLPYGKQRDTMIVFLPNQGVSLDSLLGEINSANLAVWLPKFNSQVGTVILPKFNSSYTSNLKPVLTALGMGVAFNPNLANFSNMGPALFVDSAVHETYLSVDESGTVAAAVTTIGVSATAEPVNNFTVNVNHPFVCAIMDTQTGEILFYGAIDNPAV